jgi:hypothetical protein
LNDIKMGKPNNSERNLSLCHFGHYKYHMDWPMYEPGLLMWGAGSYLPEPVHGLLCTLLYVSGLLCYDFVLWNELWMYILCRMFLDVVGGNLNSYKLYKYYVTSEWNISWNSLFETHMLHNTFKPFMDIFG